MNLEEAQSTITSAVRMALIPWQHDIPEDVRDDIYQAISDVLDDHADEFAQRYRIFANVTVPATFIVEATSEDDARERFETRSEFAEMEAFETSEWYDPDVTDVEEE